MLVSIASFGAERVKGGCLMERSESPRKYCNLALQCENWRTYCTATGTDYEERDQMS